MKPKYLLAALGSLVLVLAVVLSARAEKGQGGGGNRVQGNLTSVDADGRKIPVKGKDGDALSLNMRKAVLPVTTSDSTKAAKEASAAFTDLTPGTTVVVFTAGNDAQLSATTVVIEPTDIAPKGKGGAKAGGKHGKKKN
ncbi:MAG: hypothetical protein COZ57_02660 [Armatimonadetes bacterium CG_4_8_14_3_um_filter_66_20]|nr:hypothetical protein [Armatimonadota bacterium]PIX49701.1 MAG: hypothetical protein COZ57_02660 [Armatimonadetes bacterium CG_4_8_14_3_um_filter_66_20]